MIPSETANVLQVLAGAFRTQLGDDTALVWAQLLKDVRYEHAMEVAEMYVRTETRFPAPAEFLAGVEELARRSQISDMAERNTTAAYRCDGSRWRCAEHHGKCPIGCETPRGLEPCPTCNEELHRMMEDPKLNRLWRSGKQLPERGPLGASCAIAHPEPVVSPASDVARQAADWSNTRKDIQ